MDTIFYYVRVIANQGDKARAVQQVLTYMHLHYSTPPSTVRTPNIRSQRTLKRGITALSALTSRSEPLN